MSATDLSVLDLSAAIVVAVLALYAAKIAVGTVFYFFVLRNCPKKHQDGYAAGLIGVPPEACPYLSNDLYRESWMEGWIDGFEVRSLQSQ